VWVPADGERREAAGVPNRLLVTQLRCLRRIESAPRGSEECTADPGASPSESSESVSRSALESLPPWGSERQAGEPTLSCCRPENSF
jgi:hypothetical protein